VGVIGDGERETGGGGERGLGEGQKWTYGMATRESHGVFD
jgi:hypothetical protein